VWFDPPSGRFDVPLVPSATAGVVSPLFASGGLAGDVSTTVARYTWSQLQADEARWNAALATRLGTTRPLFWTAPDPSANPVRVNLTAALPASERIP
jgi:hypothetical protein